MKMAPLIFCLVMMGIALPLPAQPEEPRRYQQFEFDPSFVVKDRLQMEKQLGPLKDLIKKIAADPSKMPVDPAKFKDLKLDDDFKKALRDWAATDPDLKNALKDWLKKHPAGTQTNDVKQFQADLKKILEQKKKAPPPIEPPAAHVEPPKAKTDSLAKAAEKAMERAENSRFGDWLRDSPAWNRALEDLRTSMNNPGAAGMKLDGWADKFKLPDDLGWRLGEGTLDGIKHLPTPDWKGWSPSLPALGSMPTPDLSAPSLPSGSSLPSIGSEATWILLGLFCGLVIWQMLRWTKRTDADVERRAALGPWPVRPESVATRSELVQAFDYLALLTLGLHARSWNHHAVAQCWRDKSPTCAKLAGPLALLYEQARYTEGAEALTEPERDLARRSLVQLADGLSLAQLAEGL